MPKKKPYIQQSFEKLNTLYVVYSINILYPLFVQEDGDLNFTFVTNPNCKKYNKDIFNSKLQIHILRNF